MESVSLKQFFQFTADIHWCCFCSLFLCMFNSSNMIRIHVWYNNHTKLQMLLIFYLQSSTIIFRTAITFSGIMLVDGHPKCTNILYIYEVVLAHLKQNLILVVLQNIDIGSLFSQIGHCKIANCKHLIAPCQQQTNLCRSLLHILAYK